MNYATTHLEMLDTLLDQRKDGLRVIRESQCGQRQWQTSAELAEAQRRCLQWMYEEKLRVSLMETQPPADPNWQAATGLLTRAVTCRWAKKWRRQERLGVNDEATPSSRSPATTHFETYLTRARLVIYTLPGASQSFFSASLDS